MLVFLSITLHCSSLQTYEETRLLLGTIVRIKVYGKDKKIMKHIVDKAFKEMQRIDSLTNLFNPKSAISQLNRKKTIVNQELAQIVEKAIEISKWSNGAFDITVYPLLKVWGFYDTLPPKKIPEPSCIKEILKNVSYKRIKIHQDSIILNECSIDLSGIAKGYAVDRAVKILLSSHGIIKKGLVDAGGDIRCFGTNHEKWRIGIKNPRGNDIIMIKEIGNVSIATSGDYENFYIINKRRYHHLINPKTGYPAEECISATVIAEDALTADAMATALFVMGKRGIELLNSLSLGVQGMIIVKKKNALQFIKTKNWE